MKYSKSDAKYEASDCTLSGPEEAEVQKGHKKSPGLIEKTRRFFAAAHDEKAAA